MMSKKKPGASPSVQPALRAYSLTPSEKRAIRKYDVLLFIVIPTVCLTFLALQHRETWAINALAICLYALPLYWIICYFIRRTIQERRDRDIGKLVQVTGDYPYSSYSAPSVLVSLSTLAASLGGIATHLSQSDTSHREHGTSTLDALNESQNTTAKLNSVSHGTPTMGWEATPPSSKFQIDKATFDSNKPSTITSVVRTVITRHGDEVTRILTPTPQNTFQIGAHTPTLTARLFDYYFPDSPDTQWNSFMSGVIAVVLWSAQTVGSGILGNFAYDALKKLIAQRRKRSSSQSQAQWDTIENHCELISQILAEASITGRNIHVDEIMRQTGIQDPKIVKSWLKLFGAEYVRSGPAHGTYKIMPQDRSR